MSRDPKSFLMGPEIHDYVLKHSSPLDEIQHELIQETQSLGGIALMQIAPEQGAFMTLLARVMGAKRAVEVGTFTGYSTLCLARGLLEGGRLISCDVSQEWTSIGRRYWEKAGLADRIELKLAPALETLRSLPQEATIDLSFIDADKTNYIAYFDELVPRTRPNGVILVDNVLWSGNVVKPEAQDDNTLAIREFNTKVANDSRVECVMLPISDGLTLLRKR